MNEHLPLLVFPQARRALPPTGKGFPLTSPRVPDHARQVARLKGQLDQLQDEFSKYQASLAGSVAGLEPEMVLVIEIAGRVADFKRAIDATNGLEWLGEWDIEDIEPDEDFYYAPNIGVDFFRHKIDGVSTREQSREIRDFLLRRGYIDERGNLIGEEIPELSLPEHFAFASGGIINAINEAKGTKRLDGRLFLSMSNEQGQRELLSLWRRWERGEELPRGKTKWRDIFSSITKIRRWGVQETLYGTGMVERWRELMDSDHSEQDVPFQVELFYSSNESKRRKNEKTLSSLLNGLGGETLGPNRFIEMPSIAFHAAKAKLPTGRIRELLDALESSDEGIDVDLLKFPGIMYFRPTGQNLTTSGDDAGVDAEFPESQAELPPIAAILDGAPNLQHKALTDHLLFDDPDNLSSKYQPGERKHGTAMASLVVRGELTDETSEPLPRVVYHAAVMQPNPADQGCEHIPNEVFFEDRIWRAVRRMFEGEGGVPAQAPDVKIINLSIGDPERPFIHTPSPWARLLDWLSWKYRVLFCVSAGNFAESLDIGIPRLDFEALTDEEKIAHTLKRIDGQLSQRRLLSPAESLNALTVGALHADSSGDYDMGSRIDLLPNTELPSPITRLGHGFRRSVKPEVLFPGGRQLYHDTPTNGHHYRLHGTLQAPGQKVAYDLRQQGGTSSYAYTRGTSNAAALATRGGARIYEVLSELQAEHGEQIKDELMAVLIKALLVHGAKHPEQGKSHLAAALKNSSNSRRFKVVAARYMGYGMVDIERVLACTEQRATVLGCDEIEADTVHEYRFPLPVGLSGYGEWRRMTVTLAWFSPINPAHRDLREAKLSLSPPGKWDDVPLRIQRQDSDHNQVLHGTVQHEILEGESTITEFLDGEEVVLNVHCRKDATEGLDQTIPYGLAVSLEVADGVDIAIYQQVRNRIRSPVPVGASGEET